MENPFNLNRDALQAENREGGQRTLLSCYLAIWSCVPADRAILDGFSEPPAAALQSFPFYSLHPKP